LTLQVQNVHDAVKFEEQNLAGKIPRLSIVSVHDKVIKISMPILWSHTQNLINNETLKKIKCFSYHQNAPKVRLKRARFGAK
jgi:hypothetical protein